jgi:hypothetical protein
MLLLESTSTYNNSRTATITFKNGGGGYWPLARLNGIDTSVTTGGTFSSDFSIDVGNNTIWTERLRIKGDTGRVGIGLIGPSELLHVNGNIRGSSIIGTTITGGTGILTNLTNTNISSGTIRATTVVVSSDVTIGGNLTVNGTTTTVNTTTTY